MTDKIEWAGVPGPWVALKTATKARGFDVVTKWDARVCSVTDFRSESGDITRRAITEVPAMVQALRAVSSMLPDRYRSDAELRREIASILARIDGKGE